MICYSRRLAPVVLVLAVLSLTACPSQKDIDRMASASRELAHDTVTVERAVGAVYASGHLSKARKDSYAAKLKDVAIKGKAFNDILVDLDKKYPEGTLPPGTLQTLNNEFAPLSALITSIIADLTSDGLRKSGADLDKHTQTITEVLSK